MKMATIAGILLIVLGIISLAYQGINYTTHKNVVDIGPIHATEEQHHRVPLPPLLGGISLVGGVLLVVSGSRAAGK